MELTIVEQKGWRKPYKFEKAVVRIGSATASDIQLPSSIISPIHLQVMCAPETPGSCKVLNLGPVVQWKSAGKESAIESYMAVDARDGDELTLAEYRILFHLPLSAGIMMSSRQIAASLSMGDAVLRSEIPTTGFLRLQNLGKNPNCQFLVVLNGLPEECFQIDPPPILYPGAEEDVRIQFFHRSTVPPAGQQVFTISVTAPASYPGEQVIIQQGVYVNPVLKAEINLVDDMPVPKVQSAVTGPISGTNAIASVSKTESPAPASTVEKNEKLQMASDLAGAPLPKAEVSEASSAPEINSPTPVSSKGELRTVSVADGVSLSKDVPEPLPTFEVRPAPRKPKIKPSIVVTSPSDGTDELPAIPPLAPPEPAIPVQKDIFATKIVKNPSETYWDEKS